MRSLKTAEHRKPYFRNDAKRQEQPLQCSFTTHSVNLKTCLAFLLSRALDFAGPVQLMRH